VIGFGIGLVSCCRDMGELSEVRPVWVLPWCTVVWVSGMVWMIDSCRCGGELRIGAAREELQGG
jgi:hypothetical protein